MAGAAVHGAAEAVLGALAAQHQPPSEVARTRRRVGLRRAPWFTWDPVGALNIEDHALLGDGRSAALVDRAGSVVWLCWPRFESAPIFAALLDPARGGRFRVAPREPACTTWRYLEGTNVLETRHHTAGGVAVVTDLMPVASEAHKNRERVPERELLRRVVCLEGEVVLDVEYAPRPDFGRARVRLEDGGPFGIRLGHRRSVTILRADVPLAIAGDVARGELRMSAGDVVDLSLSFTEEAPAVLPPLGDRVTAAIDRTIEWWRCWSARCRYHGPYRDEVLRSALVLKLMTFSPSGAIVAAPTTSLPERIGGDLNWDYRYCWLRDAAFTVRALADLGYLDEASSFVDWMLHATHLTRPELRVLYDVYGRTVEREYTIPELSGWRGSRPVRVGNAAGVQLQLDCHGDVIDATALLVRHGYELDRTQRRMLVELGEWVCRNWERPDSGIWEPRGTPQQYTHSKVLCWVALERLLELHEKIGLTKLPEARFRSNRARLEGLVRSQGWSDEKESYVQVLGGETIDASLLVLGWDGFEKPASRRMRSTCLRVARDLGAGRALLHRNEQSRDRGEGAFGICSFWMAEILARGAGTLGEARGWFEELLGQASDLGLYAEEIDPRTGAALGNFPQAFTHIGLISAALAIEERAGNELRREPQRREEEAAAWT